MADTKYQVVAPYVTLKVKDAAGGSVIMGYYAGGVVGQEIEEESLQRHLDSGMVVAVDVDKDGFVGDPDGVEFGPGGAGAPDLDLIGSAGQGSDAGPVGGDSDSDESPGGNASRADWVDYARAQGAPEEELADPADGGLKRDELAAKYGA